MKQILLFIVCLFGLGTMAVHARENSEPADLALYQQAVKAIKDMKFVLRANQFIDGDDGKLFSVSPTMNYVVVEGDKVLMKYNPQYGIGNGKEGEISNFKIKEDKKGNIEVRMTMSSGATSSKLKFYLEKGSDRCTFTCYPIRRNLKFKFIGVLTPFVASDIQLKGACY